MTPLITQTTPLLAVDRIEPVLPFWARLGAAVVTEVPEGECREGLAFVILAAPGLMLMYQTVHSIQADLAASAIDPGTFRATPQQGYLYIKVPDLAAVVAALGDARLLMAQRTTFYGATECCYDDGAGNAITFAQFAPESD